MISSNFNAWTLEWRSRNTKTRECSILEAVALLGILSANKRDVKTYREKGFGAVIDLIFVDTIMTRKHVSEVTCSDH